MGRLLSTSPFRLLLCLLLGSLLLASSFRLLRGLLLRGLLLCCLLLTRLLCLLLGGLLLRLLLSGLLLAGFFRLLLLRGRLNRLLLSGLLLTSLFCLLLLRLLLRGLLLPGFFRPLLRCLLLCCLLLCCLLLSGLLLLRRRRPVSASRFSLLWGHNRNGRIGRLVRRYIRRLGVGSRLRGASDRLFSRTVRVQGRGFAGRRLFYQGVGCRDVRRTQALYLLGRERPARIFGQLLLLLSKRNWRWRRCCLCHYKAVNDRFRRLSHTVGRFGCGSQNAFPGWSYHGPWCDGSRGDLFCVYRHSCSRHWRRACERSLRDGGHCPGHSLVYICDVSDIAVVCDLIVIDVGDSGGADVGVASVDTIKVSTTGGIRGHINFPRTEREPAYIATAVTTSAD